MSEEKKVNKWVKRGCYAWACFYCIIALYVDSSLTILFFLLGLIHLWFAKKCSDWAVKINKNLNVAYLLGFILSFYGLFGYYIYYRIKKK